MDKILNEIYSRYSKNSGRKKKRNNTSSNSNSDPNIFHAKKLENLFLECDSNLSFVSKIRKIIIIPQRRITSKEITKDFIISNIEECTRIFKEYLENALTDSIQYLISYHMHTMEILRTSYLLSKGITVDIDYDIDEEDVDNIREKITNKKFRFNENITNSFISSLYVNQKKCLIDFGCLLHEKNMEIKQLQEKLKKYES